MKRTLPDLLPHHLLSRVFPGGIGCGRFLSGLIFMFLGVGSGYGQTDFAPGQIMFTGYDSDDPDAFSIVILLDVVAGTDIYITDRGWSNTGGFRVDNTSEGT